MHFQSRFMIMERIKLNRGKVKKSFWSGSKQAWLLFIRYCLGCICSILSEYSRKLKASPFAHVRFHNAPHCLHPVICHLPGKPDMSSDSLRSASRSETFSREFSGLHYCLFVKVLCLASFKSTDVRLSYNSRWRIRCQRVFWKFLKKILPKFLLCFACSFHGLYKT